MTQKEIYWFYRLGLRIIPIMLMVCHWIGLMEAYGGTESNEVLTVSDYVMSYVLPFFMLPATYLMRFSWGWRIPFIYLTGVNAVMCVYGHRGTMSEMMYADAVLIGGTLLLYTIWLLSLLTSSSDEGHKERPC